MNNRRYIIYGLFDGKRCRYVGATSQPKLRIHRHELDGWISKFPELTAKVLCKCRGSEAAIRLERRMIFQLKPDLNKRMGGGGELVRSLESRQLGGAKAWQTRLANLRAKAAKHKPLSPPMNGGE